jgi:small subunit ribosomal protein S7
VPTLARFNSTAVPPQPQVQPKQEKPQQAQPKQKKSKQAAKTANSSVLAEIYPINKNTIEEKDLDDWLNAVEKLKQHVGVKNTAEEIYLNELTKPSQFMVKEFEPTAEQVQETQRYAGKEIPLKSDPTVDNLINLIMRHGRKARARKIVSRAFYIIQLKMRRDPIEILKETLDKLGPLVTTRTLSTGVAKKMVVPIALSEKKRNRFAITWILDASKNRKSNDFAVRLAEEIMNAYEGKSSGYDKKALMHRQATQQRAYIKL